MEARHTVLLIDGVRYGSATAGTPTWEAVPVAMIDERNSSLEAAQRFADQRAEGRKRKRDADALDAMAAAIILERWLAAPQDAVAVA